MANYVDIETSAEALQEDEELIEAVEAIVEIAAVSVKSQITHEINTFLEQAQTIVDTLFPILVDYRIDPFLIWSDLQHVGLFAALAVLAFVILAPHQGQKRKRTKAI